MNKNPTNTNLTNTANDMANEGSKALTNITSSLGKVKKGLNELGKDAAEGFNQAKDNFNTVKNKANAGLQSAKQTATGVIAAVKAPKEGNLGPDNVGGTFDNGMRQGYASLKKAKDDVVDGVKSAQKFTRDAKQAYKNTVQSGTPATVGGRKRRTRRKRRRKGKKSRRSRRKKRKGRKSRRSRRKKRKGKKSRRKKRRTRRRR